MGKQCTRLRCHIITAQPASCGVGLRMIFYRFPVSRTSQSWKPRRLPATSCLDVCRMDQRSLNFLANMHRKLGQRSCIQKSGLSEKDKVAGATRSKEKNENASNGRARPPDAPEFSDTRYGRLGDASLPSAMIGEGTHSTNQ